MSETIDQTLWYKIRYTPLRDVLRGKLTARLDLRRQLEETALPPEVKHLLRRVVQATRLWRLEQLEVQQELIAHFTDGIASGVSAEELIKTFGDEQRAAQLIRRAKRRNRPLPWHALRYAGWSTAALLVLYCGYAAYFFAGRPSPRVNYVDIINKTIESTPLEDRGWTFYRRALIGTDFRTQSQNGSFYGLERLTTEDRRAELTEFVRANQAQIASIREGTTKSQLGWVLGAKGSVNDLELSHTQNQNSVDKGSEPLDMASLPPVSGLRYLAMLLRADAIVAGQAGDGKRMLQDFRSTLSLSQQIGDRSPLLLGLISMAISEMAMEDMEYALLKHSTLIKKEDWLALNHRLSEPKVAADLFSFASERMVFDDRLQRAFTDDGSGNGRLTSEGLVFFGSFDSPNKMTRWWEKAIQPAAGLISPSRQALKSEFSEALDLAETNSKLALRDADWHNAQETRSWKRFPINIGMPSLYRTLGAAERVLGHRDGVVIGIGLELYRQEHGSYPETLDKLVPGFLPELPVDRITGAPVHYRVVAGRPLVYSVGADRNDDGGQYSLSATWWDSHAKDPPKGDWFLFPTLK